MRLHLPAAALARVALAALFAAPSAAVAQPPRLLRAPSLSATQIAFRYADDIWIVARAGGAAQRLTSTANVVDGPFFSPDGRSIAYTARAGAGVSTYVIPAAGGAATRITFDPAGDVVVGWSPDGHDVLVTSASNSFNDFSQLFRVHADGHGLPERLPLPSVDQATYSPDGTQIAYTPFNQWQAAWKRYRGGQTQPIWIVDAKTLDLIKIPRDNSNDKSPAWLGDTIYFLSDRNGPVALFAYDTKSKAVKQVVANANGLDFKTAGAGPGGVVYEQFGAIHLYDPSSGTEHPVTVTLGGDLPALEPHLATIRPDEIQNFFVSPTGVRALFEAHGDIFTVPSEKGDVRNLTNTSNAAEREPAWSPDGKWIAYFSDASGEYQLYLRDQDGLLPPRVFDLGPDPTYYYEIAWSPDSKRLAFGDKRLNLWLLDLTTPSPKPVKVDSDNYDFFAAHVFQSSFSPDGKWIVYVKQLANREHAAFLYSLESKTATQVTDGMSDVASPAFDPSGKYLYFTASTDIGPAADPFNLSSLNRTTTSHVYVAVLSKALPSPIPPESDDEKAKGAADSSKKPSPAEAKASDEPKRGAKKATADSAKAIEGKLPVMTVDLEKIQQRIVSLPIPPRNYVTLRVGKTGVIYVGEGPPAANPSAQDGPLTYRSIWRFTLEKRKAEDVLHDVRAYLTSFDGEKLLYQKGDGWAIAGADDLKPDAADGTPGKPLRVTEMQAKIDPRAEWKQMYAETWRIEREFLYDPGFHGLDLKKASAKYAPWVDGLSSRSDLTYLQEEMLGEITIGHMFINSPRMPWDGPRTGLLGADYAIDQNRYRFAHIISGGNWNPALYAPLTQPGVNVREGEYLLAVNGVPLHATDNLYAAFEGTAGHQVVISVGPDADGSKARDVTVVPVPSEHAMRNLAWIEGNIRKTDSLSGGEVAYVYMPNTAGGGFDNFARYFFAQTEKHAVVVDERYNEGGLLADFVIDVLKRVPSWNYETRQGKNVQEPTGAILGPKAMIINQSAGSGGDAMPWLFKNAKLGPLVGVKTWGGLVGIGGYPVLLDGGTVTAPRGAIYGLKGEFEVENIGISPDVEVEYDPKSVAAGHDPQLERAVAIVLAGLKEHPPVTFPVPPYPNYHKDDGLGH